MSESISASERVQAAFKQLSASAANLNSASDELGKTVSALDAALKKLNLGVSAWVTITGDEDGHGDYWSRDIGYAKVGDEWGIALRKTRGNYNFDEFSEEPWLFNDAPRWMRIEGVGKIPELLEKLVEQADETTKRIKKTSADAKELSAAIRAAAAESEGTRRK